VQAQAWLARLPAPVRVNGLASEAPQLANRIAGTWDDIGSTAALLEALVVDGVSALPVGIAAELLRLYDYHVRCRGRDAPSTTWELPVCGYPDRARVAGGSA